MQGIDVPIPSPLTEQAARWNSLKRWERRDLGRALRGLGLSYREIMRVIPVSKGTLAGWCREVMLDAGAQARLISLRPSRAAMVRAGRLRTERSVKRRTSVVAEARDQARALADDPSWMAGVVAYWAEGAKRSNRLGFSNSDPAMIRLFMRWCTRYLDVTPDRFVAALHLHSGQDARASVRWWSDQTGIPREAFRKTYIKKEGTGHRKNVLYNGTIQVRVRRSQDLLFRVHGWIEFLRAASLP